MLLLGSSTSSVNGIQIRNQFVDQKDQVEADNWMEVSKGTRSGDDIESFVDELAKDADKNKEAEQQAKAEEKKQDAEKQAAIEENVESDMASIEKQKAQEFKSQLANSKQNSLTEADASATSDPIHGSLGPPKCKDDDFANPEQRLMDKLRNSKAQSFEDDPEVLPDTENSIKKAEKIVGDKLRQPSSHKESWWYFDMDHFRNKGMKPGGGVNRGPMYDASEEHDTDIEGTLKSAKLAEDFYGVRHPNRFTGEFDQNGKHVVSGDASGKGKFQNRGAHANLPGGADGGEEGPIEEVKFDKDGNPIEKPNKFKNKYKNKKGENCDPNDPTGLGGYCGAPLDPDDPDYQDDFSKSPFTTYYGAKHLAGNHPKDWWNHLIKDRLADAGYPGDGMLSSKLLNAGNKNKLKLKFGEDWDYMSEDQKDKLEKEEMDKAAVEAGTKATKSKLTKKDRDTVKDLDQVAGSSHLVNYTKKDNDYDPTPKTIEQQEKEEEKLAKEGPHDEGEEEDHSPGTPESKVSQPEAEGEGEDHEEGEDHDEGEEEGEDHDEGEGDVDEDAGPGSESGAPGNPAPEAEKEDASESGGGAPPEEEKPAEGGDEAAEEGEGEDQEEGEEDEEGEKEGEDHEEGEKEGEDHEEGEKEDKDQEKEGKPEGDKPAEEKPAGDKPADEPAKPEGEKPAEENPAGDGKPDEGAAPAKGGEKPAVEPTKKPESPKEKEEKKQDKKDEKKDNAKPDPITDDEQAGSKVREPEAPEVADPEADDVRPEHSTPEDKEAEEKGGHGGHGPPKRGGHGGHGPPKRGGHGGHGPPKRGGHGGHGPKKGGHGHGGGHGHKHGPPGGAKKQGHGGGGPPGAGGHGGHGPPGGAKKGGHGGHGPPKKGGHGGHGPPKKGGHGGHGGGHGHKHGPPGGAKKQGHGGHGPPKKGGHGGHGPPKRGGHGHGKKGGHGHGHGGPGHKHGPPGGARKQGHGGGGPPGRRGGHAHVQIAKSSSFTNPEVQAEANDAADLIKTNQEIQAMDFHSTLGAVKIDNDDVSLDDISKQKVQNHYDDNIFTEDLQISSELIIDRAEFESNQQKLEHLILLQNQELNQDKLIQLNLMH